MKYINPKLTKSIFVFVMAALLIFILDRILKEIAVFYLTDNIIIIEDFFRFTYSENTGVAFGMPLPFVIQIILVPVLLAVGFYLILKNLEFERLIVAAITGLIAGAAIGNYTDRLIHGFVIDYISVWIWPIFNLADIIITLGIFTIFIFYGKIKRV